MTPTKWKSFAPTHADSEYLALLSYLPIKRFRTIPRFLKYTFEIEQQLRESKGLIGYSLQAQPLSGRFWTLSVWEDDKALMEFVRRVPHGEVMKRLVRDMGETKFTQWKIKGSAVPVTWEDAKGRMYRT